MQPSSDSGPTRAHEHILPNLDLSAASLRVRFIVALVWLSIACAATSANAQITWLNFEDGDILNVSAAEGLPPGHLSFHARRGVEKSDERGKLLLHHFGFQYGVTPFLTMGGSTRHMQQRRGNEFKDGLGDSNIFLKAYHRPWADSPFSFGLRQSLSLPTGYEAERAGLASFTSRKNDYAGQILLTYRTARFGAHISPGVILPGGDAPTYLTAGLGLDLNQLLPFAVDVSGEYFTRWNMVAEEFETDVFLSFHRNLWWGLAADGGVKRRLLHTESIAPEYHLGLSFGRVHDPSADLRSLPPPKYPAVDLVVLPITTLVSDPWGVTDLLYAEFRTAGFRQENGVPILIRTALETRPREHRHYTIELRILRLEEGMVGGPRLPMVFKAPQAGTELHVEIELLGPEGVPLGRRTVFTASAHQGMGAELAPANTNYETMIVPDEIRNGLRREVTEKLAADIVKTVCQVIGERESR